MLRECCFSVVVSVIVLLETAISLTYHDHRREEAVSWESADCFLIELIFAIHFYLQIHYSKTISFNLT